MVGTTTAGVTPADLLDALLPRPREVARRPGTLLLPRGAAVLGEGHPDAARAARDFRTRLRAVQGFAPATSAGATNAKGLIVFQRVAEPIHAPTAPGSDESYTLHITRTRAVIRAHTPAGLYYGGHTLERLLVPDEDGWRVACCELTDWPRFHWRGLLVAPSQGFMPWAEMKRTIDLMAHSKLNRLHWHLTDNVLFTPRLKCHPRLAEPLDAKTAAATGTYTHQDLRRVVEYAAARQIEVIPEIEFPGHAGCILAHYPQLRCQPPSGDVSKFTLCIGAEATYTFFEQIIDELAPIFSGRFFHIGTDEVEFLDIPAAEVFHNWSTCPVCQARMRERGLTDVRALFYDAAARMRAMLAKHGKTMVMWNDQIDSARPKEVTLPRDVAMQFWRIAAPGRGPSQGCTYERLAKLGFPIINSFFPDTYIDLYIQEPRLLNWTPLTSPPLPAERPAEQVWGSTMCAWEHLPIYDRVLPSAIPLFADRLWNSEPIGDARAFGERVARHIFGPALPAGLEHIFEALGGIILPLNQDPTQLAHLGRSLPGRTDTERLAIYDAMLASIKTAQQGSANEGRALHARNLRDPAALKEYRRCLLWLRDQIHGLTLGISRL